LINATSTVVLNSIVKINATVTDNVAVSSVIIQYDPPNDIAYNATAPSNSGSEYFNDTVVLSQLGQWIFTFFANDTSGNNATSATAKDLAGNSYIEVVSAPGPGGGSGGGGGGGGGGTKISEKPAIDYDFSRSAEYTIRSHEGDIKIFSFDNKIKHSMELQEITTEYATLIFRSAYTGTVTLRLGESKEIDLNQDSNNDLLITLNKITDKVAFLTLTKLAGSEFIDEGIPEPEIPEEPKEGKPKTEFPGQLISKIKEIQELPLMNIIIVFLILTVLVFSIVLFRSKSNKKRKKKEK